MKRVTGKDGKIYFAVKNFKVSTDLMGDFKLDLENLFNGQKELSKYNKEIRSNKNYPK